jgi:hypothetical protein
VWADNEVSVNAALATRAQRELVEVLEEILLFQCPLEDLVKRLFRTQDQVEE